MRSFPVGIAVPGSRHSCRVDLGRLGRQPIHGPQHAHPVYLWFVLQNAVMQIEAPHNLSASHRGSTAGGIHMNRGWRVPPDPARNLQIAGTGQ